MKLVSLGLVSAAVVGTALAQYPYSGIHVEDVAGNSHNLSHRVRNQCREITRLQTLVDEISNPTWIIIHTHANGSQEAAIQAAAQIASSKLVRLKSNAGLTTTCNVVFARNAENQQCRTISRAEHLAKIVANATLLNEVTQGNTTAANILIAQAASDKTTLQPLQSNLTLTQYCSVRTTENHCRQLRKLEREAQLAHNSTALAQRFRNNESRIAGFQRHVNEHATKLSALEANTTLQSFCQANAQSLGLTKNANTPGSAGVKNLGAPLSLAALLLMTVALL